MHVFLCIFVQKYIVLLCGTDRIVPWDRCTAWALDVKRILSAWMRCYEYEEFLLGNCQGSHRWQMNFFSGSFYF